MTSQSQKAGSLIEIGQKLVGHAKSASFTANRGLVIELFPFIVEATERMSARAISRYLEDEQKIKLSAVTITKALNDPSKYWLAFFDMIEPAATVVAKWFRPCSFDFLFETKRAFQERLSFEREGVITGAIARRTVAFLNPEMSKAGELLQEKWFSISLGTRIKAKSYLEEHLMTLKDKCK